MAILTLDDFESKLRDRYKDDTSDEAISALEDIADTMGDIRARIGEDWKTKYEKNDKSWRDKYTARFFEDSNPVVNPNGSPEEPDVYDYEAVENEQQEETYNSVEDLLKEG